jgi:hypothetical protein
MTEEYLVSDFIVVNLVIKAPALQTTDPAAEIWFRRLARLLRGVCLPKEGYVKLFEGRAYLPVYANNLDPKYSCSWVDEGDGGRGHVILAWVDQPKMRVRVKVQFRVAPDESRAWLGLEYNPTSLTVGHNVHPTAYVDPQTGEFVIWPSSSWPAMTRTFGLGFDFLEAMSEPEPLFDDAARLAIERGDVPLASEQWAATKTVPSIIDFLQVGTVTYAQTKARGETSVDNAKDLGLDFKPYQHEDPNEESLSGITLTKKHGKKVHVLVSYYDKLVRVREMHQESTLSLAEAVTVDQSVRMDITAHPSFNLTMVNAAREKVANMDEADRKFFDFLSPDEFLAGTPKSTVWWVQRAMFLLSHRRQQGRWVRYSFATWLVPFVEKHVLHNDVIAGITTRGYHALLALNDPVAAAWRSDPTPGAGNWAGRLARIAGCARATVFNRRNEWRHTYGIDIAYPLQMFSDILYFGSNSVAKPESITAMMVAVKQKRGGKVVRLHAEAIADFERKRVRILNPVLMRRPRAMELTLPPIALPPLASPALPELVDFVDLDDDDLNQAFPSKPVPTQPTIVSSVLKAPRAEPGSATTLGMALVLRDGRPPAMELKPPLIALPELGNLEDSPDLIDDDPVEAYSKRTVAAKQPIAVGRGLATKPRTKVLVMQGRPSPPPPERKVLLIRVRSDPAPKTRTKVIMMRDGPSAPRRPTGPHAMEPKRPPIAPPDPHGLEDLIHIDDVDLHEAAPAKPLSAKSNIASSSARPAAPQVKGMAQKKVVLLAKPGRPHAIEPKQPPISLPVSEAEDFLDVDDVTFVVGERPPTKPARRVVSRIRRSPTPPKTRSGPSRIRRRKTGHPR